MKMIDIAIIGGGASGLVAAICAAQRRPSLSVVLLERATRVGKKLLATGNGRCNLGNTHALSGGYHGDTEAAQRILQAYPPETVARFFTQIGLRVTTDAEGRMYPQCNQAAAVLDALRLRAQELGVEEVCDYDCASLRPTGSGFTLRSEEGVTLQARRVLLCTGGMAAPKLGGTDKGVKLLCGLGHRAAARAPSLTQLEVDAEAIRGLKGLRYQGGISLQVDGRRLRREEGEILFGEETLSGIAAMQLSRDAGEALHRRRKAEVCLHILPDDSEDLLRELQARAEGMSERECNDFLTGLVGKRIGQTLCKQAGITPLTRPVHSLSVQALASIAKLLTGWTLPVLSVKGFDCAQVTAGGALLREFDEHLQSRIVPGLYAAGETLNVDGDCGGYNLQWAWASGMQAGRCAADSFDTRKR